MSAEYEAPNPIVKSLRYCQGYTKNSLISTVLPAHDRLLETQSELKSMADTAEREINIIHGLDEDCDDMDDEVAEDMINLSKSAREASDFISAVKYQDTDKHAGLILFYGYIKDVTGKPQKIYHTFPFPAGIPALDDVSKVTSSGQRFNLELLNRNPWYTDVFPMVN